MGKNRLVGHLDNINECIGEKHFPLRDKQDNFVQKRHFPHRLEFFSTLASIIMMKKCFILLEQL